METESTLMPQEFIRFMDRKLEKNREGRPHFLAVLGKEGRNVMREVLNILEFAWIKQRSLRSIARKYTTSYDTIRRFLNDLETLGLKGEIIRFLM